jgi:hypothetical protein
MQVGNGRLSRSASLPVMPTADPSPSKAASAAGYAFPQQQGSRLLSYPEIAAAVWADLAA